MLTTTRYLDLMGHALGKTVQARHRLIESLNNAGVRLFNEHSWNWRLRGPVQVAVVAGQPWIDLPADFGHHTAIYVDNTNPSVGFRKVVVTSIEHLTSLREQSVGRDLGDMFVAPGLWSAAGEAAPRWLVWPTPAVSGQPTISLIYRARWRTLTEGDPNGVPNIPEVAERALMLAARAEAQLVEFQDPQSADELAYREEIDRLKAEDGRELAAVGLPIRGGAFDVAAMSNRTDPRPLGVVNL